MDDAEVDGDPVDTMLPDFAWMDTPASFWFAKPFAGLATGLVSKDKAVDAEETFDTKLNLKVINCLSVYYFRVFLETLTPSVFIARCLTT
ncbi:hypothetical protein PXK20_03380 [Phaeobacter gallaeciensis]|nr:hypothetical protein [Phaeobacter gallaeciensis]